jgi:DNA-binding NtrC family response regulator
MFNALLIDDEEPIRRLMKAVLEMGDFSVTTAGSAKSGIEILQSQHFDVVVTDLRMETQLAGYDVVKFAKTRVPHAVVVIVTAFPVPAVEWRRVGADALFTKGADTHHLSDRLKDLLQRKRLAVQGGAIQPRTPGVRQN